MTIILSDVCSNPQCYNKPTVKRTTTVGLLRLETPLCNNCATLASTVDTAKDMARKKMIFEAMSNYYALHQMQGKVPDEMLTMAVERILDETVAKL